MLIKVLTKYLFLPLFCLCVALPVFASSNDSILGLSPFLIEQETNRGKVLNETITVTNVGTETRELTVALQDFFPVDQDGGVDFLPPGKFAPSASGLARWITVLENPKNILLPGESTQVKFEIKVPIDAESGAHFGALVFSFRENIFASTGTGILPQAAALIILDVDRSFERGEISSFQRKDLGNGSTELNFHTLYKNSGASSLKPKGEIALYNIWNKKIASVFVNPDALTVLPNSERLFVSKIAGQSFFGRYKAILTIYYGSKKLQTVSQISFWIISWTQVVLWIIALAIIIALLIFGIKRYNRWIVEKD
jgi:hypothetical protein